MFHQDEDDDDDFELSEFEEWYDNNFMYFQHEKDHEYGPTPEIETFYNTVYKPFMRDLKKPLRQLVENHYPHIGSEHRPEVLTKIDSDIDWTGHEFILFLRNANEFLKTGKDIHEMYPDYDSWVETIATYRKPHYLDLSFLQKTEGITDEIIQTIEAESIVESNELFEFEEKPRSEFYKLVQNIIFKYYPELFDMSKDGWTLFEYFMHGEYINYQLNFEHLDSFIEYNLDIEDLDLPYMAYMEKFSVKWKERWDEEQRLLNEQESTNTDRN